MKYGSTADSVTPKYGARDEDMWHEIRHLCTLSKLASPTVEGGHYLLSLTFSV